ncbi:multiple ankyrin repeats single kh domain protein [Pyrenophora tritici-repentis]|nr:multiple ankyrin repeats single kh domain protein [Pyrenophora tritici-repentis]
MDMLETVAGWQLDNLHLLMTSRKERDIETSLEGYVGEKDAVCLQKDVVNQDIQRYVQQRLRDDKGLAKWNKDAAVRQEIDDALMSEARGMFRWAVCQLDTLAKCRNLVMLRKSLATLPQTLDQTYERILTAISEEDCVYAMRILQWLSFSARPLSVEEIAEVVAIDVTRDLAFDRDEVLEDPLEVLDICSSLVTITTNEVDRRLGSTQRIVALAHHSVQEYLVSDRIKQGLAKQYSMQEAKCHNAIARGSLNYLIQLEQPLSRETLKAFALARYTAEFWSSHLRNAGDDIEHASRLAMSLFAIKEPAYLTWIQLCDPDHPWRKPDLERSLDSIPTPLYYAALLDLRTITRMLLGKGADINAQGGFYGNALQAASLKGHEQVVETLLDKGADVNAQSGHYGNALQAASAGRHEHVVEALLDKGADVNAQSEEYGNALYAASARGYEQIVKMLLDRGADVNAQSGRYSNTLLAALYGGHEQIVKMLLNQDAHSNAQGRHYGFELVAASRCGHEQVVKLLLEHCVNVRARLSANKFELEDASNKTPRKVLVHERMNLIKQDKYYKKAVESAWNHGYPQIVILLLETDPNSNALYEASKRGYGEVVMLLLNNGAEVNVQCGEYGNALQAASAQGHEQVVKTLLVNGADVNAQGGQFGNALQAASQGGHERVVKALLDAGAHQHQENDLVLRPE